ncbi:hypothetical protein PVAP13_3NG317796 [Panicum virgatum]|uniref:Uncharacterized protein n=1 Tax=Panicum virgatum TaxID=38727 RepID=A0A8T0UKI0_PANVG|nr:hypothetical protein PVAP13_3NG317796 [Panicum virgatum]
MADCAESVRPEMPLSCSRSQPMITRTEIEEARCSALCFLCEASTSCWATRVGSRARFQKEIDLTNSTCDGTVWVHMGQVGNSKLRPPHASIFFGTIVYILAGITIACGMGVCPNLVKASA